MASKSSTLPLAQRPDARSQRFRLCHLFRGDTAFSRLSGRLSSDSDRSRPRVRKGFVHKSSGRTGMPQLADLVAASAIAKAATPSSRVTGIVPPPVTASTKADHSAAYACM